MIVFRDVTVQEPASIICDRCGRRAENGSDSFEFSEYVSIDHVCGYGSIIEDGSRFEIDLCQYCVKALLCDYARISVP